MSILAWIIFGAIAGWLASLIAGADGRIGLVGNIVIGIVGAFVGGLIASALGAGGVSGFNLYSFLVAIGGATLILFVLNAFSSRDRI